MKSKLADAYSVGGLACPTLNVPNFRFCLHHSIAASSISVPSKRALGARSLRWMSVRQQPQPESRIRMNSESSCPTLRTADSMSCAHLFPIVTKFSASGELLTR